MQRHSMQLDENALVEATRRALKELKKAAAPASSAPQTAQDVVSSASAQGVIVMPVGSRGRPRFPTRADGAEAGVVSGGFSKPTFG